MHQPGKLSLFMIHNMKWPTSLAVKYTHDGERERENQKTFLIFKNCVYICFCFFSQLAILSTVLDPPPPLTLTSQAQRQGLILCEFSKMNFLNFPMNLEITRNQFGHCFGLLCWMTCLERLDFGCVREDNEGRKFSENTLRAAEGKKVWSVMVAIVPGNEAVSMRVLMGNFGWHNKC